MGRSGSPQGARSGRLSSTDTPARDTENSELIRFAPYEALTNSLPNIARMTVSDTVSRC